MAPRRARISVDTIVYTYPLFSVETTTIFKSGNSQAVRIPKAFRLPGYRVFIERKGSTIVLSPLGEENRWPDGYIESLSKEAADKTFVLQPQGRDS